MELGMQEDIKSNLQKIKSSLPDPEPVLVAISKTKPREAIQAAYDAGHLDFGENKAQEMTTKYEVLPKDIRWHFVGHLQRNKVKYLAPYVYLIHSVDSEKLLKEIDKQAQKNNRVINCLLQMHIAQEATKFGFDEEELTSLLDEGITNKYKHVAIKGMMGMATFTDNNDQVASEFQYLKNLFENIKNRYTKEDRFEMEILSMGMSGDYEIALEKGSNMIRIGTAIFGERNYH